ncbi:NADH-quinone oxidoreductase subunit NuoE [Spiribacter aquaticus]|uniref:NADH-quinone oxidoreductase subunit E n=1 Tax=Spiribacter aquaticus TaxID=1935996 RepID=A0A557RJW6_9GAMM|nr:MULTISPECIES: NADH-quinone oxidoreductase subunit NuoE [Spiribacter]KAF0280027.1 NADH dehydrogenase [Spiribacter roseus]PYZ99827.1 NADH-quinone oxidoreductase subunit NuoE [Gammaproteobacteria bacterium 2W06]TVO65445.1 NADH-quinone oxidoreductase subunit NuoE [Spiribacter aquaticus]
MSTAESPDQNELTAPEREEIDRWLAQFPDTPEGRRSAVIPALHVVQHNTGWLPRGRMDAVAEYLGMAPARVYEVATFYGMFEVEPGGRHRVNICTNISCMLRGSDEIVEHVEKKLGISLGETTSDGRITLKREEECLAACRSAPMMLVDEVFYTDLTPEKVDRILDDLE